MFKASIDDYHVSIWNPMSAFTGDFMAEDVITLVNNICEQYFSGQKTPIQVEALASDTHPIGHRELESFNRMLRFKWEEMGEQGEDTMLKEQRTFGRTA